MPSRPATGVLFGATHDRDDAGLRRSRGRRPARNLERLASQRRPSLARAWTLRPLTGRASMRAATPDFLPLAGAAEARAGCSSSSGLGSRGFCAAPLLAEHVAAVALGRAVAAAGGAGGDRRIPGRFAMRRDAAVSGVQRRFRLRDRD